MEKHTYYYKVGKWFIFLVWGFLCETIVIMTLLNLPQLITNDLNFMDYIGLFVIIIGMLPFGVLSLLLPFTSKIILSLQGIEYHTLTCVIKLSLKDVAFGTYHSVSGEFVALRVSKLEIFPRPWTRFVPWNVPEGIFRLGIPISEFGGFKPKKLVEDIRQLAEGIRD